MFMFCLHIVSPSVILFSDNVKVFFLLRRKNQERKRSKNSHRRDYSTFTFEEYLRTVAKSANVKASVKTNDGGKRMLVER